MAAQSAFLHLTIGLRRFSVTMGFMGQLRRIRRQFLGQALGQKQNIGTGKRRLATATLSFRAGSPVGSPLHEILAAHQCKGSLSRAMAGWRPDRFRGALVFHMEGPARELGSAHRRKVDPGKPGIRQMGKCEAYGRGCAHSATIERKG